MEYLQYLALTDSLLLDPNVLNLIINGIPSILNVKLKNEFNTLNLVLNLIINGIPSIQNATMVGFAIGFAVLNLIINGIPSIHQIS